MRISNPLENPQHMTLLAVAVAGVAVWWATWAGMSGMEMSGAIGMGMLPMTAVMWVLMMLAMMLPSMAPVLSIYARLAGKETRGAALALRVTLFGLGYFTLWAVVSVVLAAAQIGLSHTTLFTMSGSMATPAMAGVLMLVAGIWQFTPVKDACLVHCRHPISFLLGHWREGTGGAFPMGLHHGLYCVGCCIAFMGLMFVFGAMNVLWMAVIAAYFVAEKIAPAAEIWSRWVGMFLCVAGVATLAYVLI